MNERTCIVCGGKGSKENLLRWVAAGNLIVPDWTRKLEGRAVYTHFDRECICGIYGAKKVFAQFGVKDGSFGVPEAEILDFVRNQTDRSVSYFISICRKSGVLVKGQNLIADAAKKGIKFSNLFSASDASEKTVAELENKTGLQAAATGLSKEEWGKKFDGRDVAVFAIKPSKQSEKLIFYMNLLNNFTAGDI